MHRLKILFVKFKESVKDMAEGLRAGPNQTQKLFTFWEALCYIGMVIFVLGSLFAMGFLIP